MKDSFIKKIYLNFQIYIDSLLEFLFIYLVSNIPLITLVIMYYFKTQEATFSIELTETIIRNNVDSGELLIYVSTLLAPFVYVMVQYNRAARHFPFYALFILLTAAIYLYCLLVFSMHRLGTLENYKLLSDTSGYFYILSLILWYFSLVFGRKLIKPERFIGSGAQTLIDLIQNRENN